MGSVLSVALIVFGLLNMAFAGAVYAHNRKNIRVIFFALISVFASLWSICTLLTSAEILTLEQFKFALYGHYIFGFGAYLAGYWFAYFYPTRSKISIAWPISVSIITLSLLSFIPTRYFFLDIHVGATIAEKTVFNLWGHGVFIAAISLVYFMVVWQLIRKLRATDGTNKKQLSVTVIEMLLVGFSGIVLNLVLPLYGNFSFFYITPFVQTLILTGIGIYNLTRNHLFNAKIIFAEFFTGAMCIVSVARLFTATSSAETLVNIFLLLATLGFGTFLIRSVLREVEQREQIQILAESLKKANDRLQELDKLKSQFLSIASHDLRAPLTTIRNFMSLLLEGAYGQIPAAANEGMRQVFDKATEMAASVENYLNVSRIEQGRMQYDFKETDIVKLVSETTSPFKSIAEQKGLAFSFKGPADLKPINVKADVPKMHEVMNLLIDNSIKYTPTGSVQVSVETIEKEGKKFAKVMIKDTGVGMSEDTIKNKLFKMFSTAEDSRKVNTSSTGVGLYVVKAHVEAHQGKVWAESEGAGKGSSFIVELPVMSS